MSAGIMETLDCLHTLIESLNEDIDDLTSAQYAPALAGLQRASNALDHSMHRLAAATARSGVWGLDGFRSAGAWIGFHSGLTRFAAGRLTRQGLALGDMPYSGAAAAAGLLNDFVVEQLTRAKARGGVLYDDGIDEAFAQVAASGDLDALAKTLRCWHEHLDALEGPEPGDDPSAPGSTMGLSQTLDGCWSGNLFLNPGDGAIVDQALQIGISGYLQRQRNGDPSLTAVDLGGLKAQALVDLAAASLRREPGDRSVPNRHHVALTLHLEQDGTVTPEGFLPPDALCDAAFFRLVLGAESEVLDLGRTTRRWDNAAGTAIRRRDKHCRFPGCDQRPGRCDIHHCTKWDDEGDTAVTNGVLLCRWHHGYVHRHHWIVTLEADQHPIFTKPDGTSHRLHRGQPASPDPP